MGAIVQGRPRPRGIRLRHRQVELRVEGLQPFAALPGGGWMVAFQANTGYLWVVGTGGVFNQVAPMASNTSPSIASRPNGTWQVAYQGSTNNNLWTYDGSLPVDQGLGMAPCGSSSPSIAAVPTGGYEMAFRANTGYLWVTGDLGRIQTPYGIASNTSPSIAEATVVAAMSTNNSRAGLPSMTAPLVGPGLPSSAITVTIADWTSASARNTQRILRKVVFIVSSSGDKNQSAAITGLDEGHLAKCSL